jgi:hypothetical protein
MRVWAWVIIGFVAARALHAFAWLIAGLGVRFDLMPDDVITGFLAQLFLAAEAGVIIAWTVYVIGYVSAAVLALRGDRRAPLVYAAAFAVDLSVWIYTATVNVYGLVIDGRVGPVDMGFNILDATLLLGLFWLRQSGRLR